MHQKLRFAAMPALLFASGLGATFYYGHAWYRLPAYSAAEIEQSVDLNLALELRHGKVPLNPAEASMSLMRQRIEADLHAEIAQEQRAVQRGVATGLVLLVLGLGQMLLMRRMAAR